MFNEKTLVPKQTIDPAIAYKVTTMLQDVVRFGTGTRAQIPGWPIAGKTGTNAPTSGQTKDVWFVGYTPTLVAGVWFGYDHPHEIAFRAAGGRFAAPAWADFYLTGWNERRGVDWEPPLNMVSAIIDPESGELANEYCPRRVREYFKPGTQPTTYCQLHTAPEQTYIAEDGTVVPSPRSNDDWFNQIGKRLKRILRF
jgi:penicillin-binding protein 1A